MANAKQQDNMLFVRYAPYTYDMTDKVFRERASGCTVSVREICIALQERDELRAENARLRAALQSVSAKLEPMQQGERNGAAMGMASQARDIARAALRETP